MATIEARRRASRNYRARNRLAENARAKAYLDAHPEKTRAYHKRWYDANKDAANARCRDYYRRNQEKMVARGAKTQRTPKGRYSMYKSGAKKRGLAFDLTFDEFMVFWQKNCGYCGSAIKTIGLDRIFNNIGYVMGNICPACKTCNWAKGRMDFRQFIDHCGQVAHFTGRIAPYDPEKHHPSRWEAQT